MSSNMKPVLKAKRRQERTEDNTDDDDATRSGGMSRVSFADPATKRRKGMEDDAVECRTNAIRFEGEEETCSLPKCEEDVPMEPFNLNAERSDGEGYFDGDTYVFRRSKEEHETDAWLDNLDHADTVLSTTTPTPVKTRTRFADDWTMERLSLRILPFLSTATEETVLQALNRYGRILRRTNKLKSNRTKNNNNNNRTKHARRRMDTHSEIGLEKQQHSDDATTTMENSHESTDNSSDQTPQINGDNGKESERSHVVTEHTKKDISRESTTDNNDMTTMALADTDTAQIAFQTLSELSNILLMQLEDKHAYDRTSAYFQSFLQGNHHDTTFTNDNNNNKRPDKSYFSNTNSPLDQNTKTELAENDNDDKPAEEYYWEYRGNQDHKIHGPYTTRQMMEWIRAGYFVGETNAVNVRRVLPTSLDHTNNNTNNTNNKELQKKEATVDGLLHDLMDNDDDDDDEEENDDDDDEKDEERLFHWQSSDKIDFAFHRSNEEKEP